MLPAGDLAELNKHLMTVELETEQTLAQPGEEIRRIYFPHSGIVSFMVEVDDGHVVQTGMVGRDGVIGAPQALDGRVSINRIVVQIPGTASMIDRVPLREAIHEGSAIRRLLVAHEQFFLADVQQTAACNALHPVEARMSRWMLRMMDLVGTSMPMTQDHLADMIGVRRSSVSDVASRMQAEGVLRYARGQIRIENVKRLRALSCECHAAVKRNYTTLLGAPPPQLN
jgi:CRP-like cAMP-binding protein